jgi:hypothetical protein
MPTGIHTEPDNLAGKAPLDPTSLLVARADLGDPLTHRYTHELPLSATGCLRAAAANRLREMPDVS